MFGSLAGRIPGCRFLDLFAGSGAVGLEAWSRGAAEVCWVEQDRLVYGCLKKNVEALCRPEQGAGEARPVLAEAFRWLERAGKASFDIVFADPPYVQGVQCPQVRALPDAVLASGVIADGGLLVVEEPAGRGEWETSSWRVVRDRNYGVSRLVFLEPGASRKEEES